MLVTRLRWNCWMELDEIWNWDRYFSSSTPPPRGWNRGAEKVIYDELDASSIVKYPKSIDFIVLEFKVLS